MKKNILILFLIFSFILSVYSEDIKNLSDIFNYNTDYSALLAKSQHIFGFYLDNNAAKDFDYTVTVDENTKEITANEQSDQYLCETVLSNNLKIKRITYTIKEKETMDNFEYNKIVTEYSKDNNFIIKKFYLNDKQTSKEYKIRYDNNTILFDTSYIVLQACLIKGIKNFNLQMLFGSQTDKHSGNIKLIQTNNLLELSPEYKNPPDFFKQRSIFKDKVNVFIFKLTGIAGSFYKHKLYFAFDSVPPYKFIAYWGGDPDDQPEFQISNK